jgi:hypothetical protein
VLKTLVEIVIWFGSFRRKSQKANPMKKNTVHKILINRYMEKASLEGIKNFLTGDGCWVDFQTRR